MTDPEDTERDDAVWAAEYALHLLDPAERASFAARLREEPALAAMVAEWQASLAGLDDEVDPVRPPARTKKALDARLFGRDAAARPWWRPLRFGLGAVAALALLALVGLYAGLWSPPAQGPAYLAEIAAEDRSLLLRASLEPGKDVLVVQPVTGAPPPGRVLELWLIADGADAPVSLGVLNTGKPTTLTLSEDLRDKFAGAVLAISDEPPGGSPTGARTGAVLAVGAVTQL